jgi:hypothetical protein
MNLHQSEYYYYMFGKIYSTPFIHPHNLLSLSQLSYEYTNIRMQPYSYEHITQFTPDIATDRVFQID